MSPKKLVYFKIEDEGWFRGVVITTRNANQLSARTRLEVEDVEQLEEGEKGDMRPIPGTMNGRVQTFTGDEIVEMKFLERTNDGISSKGVTERKMAFSNSHSKPSADLDYNSLCLAGLPLKGKIESNADAGLGEKSDFVGKEVAPETNVNHARKSSEVTFRSKSPMSPMTENSNENCFFHHQSEGQAPVTNDQVQYPNQYFIIEDLTEGFFQAIDLIKTNLEIGVSLSGLNLGRNGNLCWIQMATQKEIFLFDIIKLGHNCFDKGKLRIVYYVL